MIRAFTTAISVAALGLITALPATAQEPKGGVVSIGGAVTEIVFALGAQDQVVARDTTSSYPPEAAALPDVGYMRALSPEGVLATGPKLIIAEEGAGPPETIEVLEQADIPFVIVPDDYTAEGVSAKIRAVGQALGKGPQAEALAAEVQQKLAAVSRATQDRPEAERKRVMFILSTQGGRIMASGTDTAAASMIDLAGAVNAVTGFAGYKPITDEAVLAAAPDVLVMMAREGDHNSTEAELFAMPAISVTPAANSRSVVRMDGLYLLGFGPRTADAVADLHAALYAD